MPLPRISGTLQVIFLNRDSCSVVLLSFGLGEVWGLCLCGVQPTLSSLKRLYGLEAYSASEDFVLKGLQRLPIGRQRD